MTNSGYIAHTTPVLIKHGLLNVRDMYNLKFLKFYYKLAYDLLPPYFNYYTEVIEQKPFRILRHHYNHAPLIKVFEKCTKNLIGHSRLAFNNHESNIDC